MAGSNIFVMYTSAGGSNVTVSPRLADGYSQPDYNSAAQIALLEGSGVEGNTMTANVRCSNCASWEGGSMDFSGSSGSWIYALKSGSSLDSDDTSTSISQHDSKGVFSFDFTQARGGSGVNPFLQSGATTGGGASCTPISGNSASQTGSSPSATTSSGNPWDQWNTWSSSRPTDTPWNPNRLAKRQSSGSCPEGFELAGSSSGTTSGQSDFGQDFGQDGFGNPNGGSFAGYQQTGQKLLIAHGVMACLAFVILFPSGAILIRLASFPHLAWVHGAFQIFAYLVYIAAAGIGIYMARFLRLVRIQLMLIPTFVYRQVRC